MSKRPREEEGEPSNLRQPVARGDVFPQLPNEMLDHIMSFGDNSVRENLATARSGRDVRGFKTNERRFNSQNETLNEEFDEIKEAEDKQRGNAFWQSNREFDDEYNDLPRSERIRARKEEDREAVHDRVQDLLENLEGYGTSMVQASLFSPEAIRKYMTTMEAAHEKTQKLIRESPEYRTTEHDIVRASARVQRRSRELVRRFG